MTTQLTTRRANFYFRHESENQKLQLRRRARTRRLPPPPPSRLRVAMGKRGRDNAEDIPGLGRRRARVDLSDRAAAATTTSASYNAIGFDYGGVGGDDDGRDDDPIAAAIAAKKARQAAENAASGGGGGGGGGDGGNAEGANALAGLLGRYADADGSDDDDGDGDASGPPRPWKKLTDANTRHEYYWNQVTGAVSWTLPKREASDAATATTTTTKAVNDDAGINAKRAEECEEEDEDAASAASALDAATDLLRRARAAAPTLRATIASIPPLAVLAIELESKIEEWRRVGDGGVASEATEAARRASVESLARRLPSAIDAHDAAADPAAAARGGERAAECTVGEAKTATATATAPLSATDAAAAAAKIQETLRARVRAGLASRRGKLAGVGVAADVAPAVDAAGVGIAPVKTRGSPQIQRPPVGVVEKPPRPPPERASSPPPPPPPPPRLEYDPTHLGRRPKHRAAAATVALAVDARRVSKKLDTRELERWKAVSREAEEARAAEEASRFAGALSSKDIDAWRDAQLRSGDAAAANPNFAPVAGDWRERAAAARRRRERERHESGGDGGEENAATAAEATTSAAADAAAAAAGVDLAALTAPLPRGWRAFYDVAGKEVYYSNGAETSWDPPERESAH